MIKKFLLVFFIICISLLMFGCTNNYKYSQKINTAIEDDNFELFCSLLEKGKNFDSRPYFMGLDRVNLPPLHYACNLGKYEYVEKLIEYGADVNNTNHPIKLTPLMITLNRSINKDKFKIANLLIESGADINIEVYSFTAIDYVFTQNIINYDENTEKLEFEFAKYLIDKGASIENNNLGNLIFIASRANNLMMVKYLIESMNVDMNMQDKVCENTPLMWAVKYDCYNVVKYLIDNNANLEIKNNENKTAVDIALENNNEAIIELLNNN